MTLTMADSTTAVDLPPGCDAYAAYSDGKYKNVADIRARFPSAHLVTITVTGSDLSADCCDRETYDASAATAAKWAKAKIAAGYVRPIVYASQSAMPAVLAALTAAGVARAQVRLWTAHYGWPQHICSPTACWMPDHSVVTFTADGTQWADAGPNGEHYDQSVLNDDFFASTPVQEDDMASLIQGKGDNHWYSTDGVTKTYLPTPAVVADLVRVGALNKALPDTVDAATIAALPLNPLSPTPPSPVPSPDLTGLVVQIPAVTATIGVAK